GGLPTQSRISRPPLVGRSSAVPPTLLRKIFALSAIATLTRSAADIFPDVLVLRENWFAYLKPTGQISIAIAGSTVPGLEGNLTVIPPVGEASESPRAVDSWIGHAVEKFNSFDKSVTTTVPPIDISKNYPLFSKSLSCAGPPPFNTSISANADVNAHANISLGVAAVGTIVPPRLTQFSAFVGLDADIRNSITLVGNTIGAADSGRLTLYQAILPTLDFPGYVQLILTSSSPKKSPDVLAPSLLTVGPSFKIFGQATANVGVGVNLKVDLSYTVSGAKVVYPPVPGTNSTGIFIPGNEPLKLAVTGNVTSTSIATAQLTPRIELGLNALGGTAKATVFVNLDSRSKVLLNFNAAGNAAGSITIPSGNTTGDAGASVNGCITAGSALNANVGTDAKFFDLFDNSTSVSLYAKEWPTFQVSSCDSLQPSLIHIHFSKTEMLWRSDWNTARRAV
ncbi:hypothetical protein DXG03_006595, partial [Asterophora parasitica]